MDAQTQDSQRWAKFYQATEDKPARETLLKAMAFFEQESQLPSPRTAIDLGCGVGNDTLALLKRGWQVLAIDKEAEAIQRLRQRVPVEHHGNLTTMVSAFEELELPKANLVNASFSLPFCAPDRFAVLWGEIINSIRQGGRFAGQLFGERDQWAQDARMTFHSQHQVQRLLAPFEVEYFVEIEEDGATATGGNKHWHIFSVVAKMASSLQRQIGFQQAHKPGAG
jgi:SAM-dependent methyltransferase